MSKKLGAIQLGERPRLRTIPIHVRYEIVLDFALMTVAAAGAGSATFGAAAFGLGARLAGASRLPVPRLGSECPASLAWHCRADQRDEVREDDTLVQSGWDLEARVWSDPT